jgi:hypothetical protein
VRATGCSKPPGQQPGQAGLATPWAATRVNSANPRKTVASADLIRTWVRQMRAEVTITKTSARLAGKGRRHVEKDIGATREIGHDARDLGRPRAELGRGAALLEWARRETGEAPLVLASDNGPENKGALERWCQRHGVTRLWNLPRTPEHNPWIEHGHGELKGACGLGKGAVLDSHVDAARRLAGAAERLDRHRPAPEPWLADSPRGLPRPAPRQRAGRPPGPPPRRRLRDRGRRARLRPVPCSPPGRARGRARDHGTLRTDHKNPRTRDPDAQETGRGFIRTTVCRDRKVLPVSSALTAAAIRPLTPEFRPEGDPGKSCVQSSARSCPATTSSRISYGATL